MGQLAPERRAKIEARTNELHREYLTLRELRERLNMTQVEMAQRIGMKQPAISKLENGDRRLTLETLSEVITALGGEWELTVKLPNTEPVRLVGNEAFVPESNHLLTTDVTSAPYQTIARAPHPKATRAEVSQVLDGGAKAPST